MSPWPSNCQCFPGCVIRRLSACTRVPHREGNSLRGDWAIFCHAGSGRVGRVWSAREKSREILRHGWELNPGHGEDRQWAIPLSYHDWLWDMMEFYFAWITLFRHTLVYQMVHKRKNRSFAPLIANANRFKRFKCPNDLMFKMLCGIRCVGRIQHHHLSMQHGYSARQQAEYMDIL